jgi:threonine dehydrogenase-like Zn-dependent dehydrogenase
LDAEQVVRRLLQIVGVYNYNPEDLDAGLQFLSQIQGRFPFERLVSKSFPLSDVNAAFEFAHKHRPPRVAVLP